MPKNPAQNIEITLPYISLSASELVPVALISLLDMADRRQNINEHGIPGAWTETHFPAIDMRGVDQKSAHSFIDEARFGDHYGFIPSPAQVGCALSHREAARWLLQSKHDLLLVLEDDVLLSPEYSIAHVQRVSEAFGPHARSGASFVVHLGVDAHWHRRVMNRKVRLKANFQPDFFLFTDVSKGLWYAHAYLLSRGAAKQIVNRETKLISNVDDWLYRRELGLIDQVFYCQPHIFQQNERLPSTLEDGRQIPPNGSERGSLKSRSGCNFFYRAGRYIRFHLRKKLSQMMARRDYWLTQIDDT